VEQWLNAAVYGLAVAVVAWAATRTRLLDAAWRCRTWSAALAALALAMSLPFARLLLPEETGRHAVETAAAAWSQAPAPIASIPAVPAAVLLAAWAAVACARLGVLAVAILHIRCARRLARPMPPERLARLPEWSAANRGRFALVISDRVPTAAMLGFGRPIVAVPPAWLDRLSDAELDAVLLHELAHAERRDDLGQLADQLLLAACWFHPAAWGMAGRARFEREAACDERAARATTSRRYARCLVTLAERLPNGWTASTLAPGAVRGPDVTRRVARVMAMDSGARLARPAYFAAPTLAAIAVLTMAIPSFPRVLGVAVENARLEAENVRPRPDAATGASRAELPRENVRPRPDAAKDARRAELARESVRLRPDAARNAAPGAATSRDNVGLPDADAVRAELDATSAGTESIAATDRAPSDILPSAAAPAPVARTAQGNSLAAPFASLGASLSNAGKRTGSWFSRAGLAVADRVTGHSLAGRVPGDRPHRLTGG
jgi:beta-lactamase regulating signal transducer with metallopeptidase domain